MNLSQQVSEALASSSNDEEFRDLNAALKAVSGPINKFRLDKSDNGRLRQDIEKAAASMNDAQRKSVLREVDAMHGVVQQAIHDATAKPSQRRFGSRPS